MASIEKFEDLRIWQQCRTLCKEVRELILSIDNIEYSLRNQIYSSSGSVMDNIAEGFERDGTKEFKQFLSIAKGSVGETRSQLYRIEDHHPNKKEETKQLREMASGISRGIRSLMEHLKRTDYKGHKFEEDQAPYGLNEIDQLR